jgi:alkylhydroperoxidase/carboxymuconolactone decarboxylase family protein YurZ
MADRPTGFMVQLKAHDPEFFEAVSKVMAEAQGAGALDEKTKTLIMLALDAAGGHPEGVKHVAIRAKALGVSKAEIIETIRLAFVVSGVPGLVAGLAALQE